MTKISTPEDLREIDFLKMNAQAEIESIREVAGWFGKLGLTALVPPVGLPLFFKKRKIAATLAGVALSLGLNVGYGTSQDKDLYDNPSVSVYNKSNNGFFTFFASLTSPAIFSYSLDQVTTLKSGDKNAPASEVKQYTIDGKDVITFDEKTRQYTLHISSNKSFKISPNKNYTSVSEAQVRLGNLTGKLEKLTAEGDIAGARKALTEITSEKARYDATVSQYNETKAAYEAAVAKMNAELSSLRNFGKTQEAKK